MPTALITGAAARLGAVIALKFAEEGWDLVIHANSSRQKAEDFVVRLQAMGHRATALFADLGETAECRALIDRAFAAAPDLCVLVNSASVFEYDDADHPDESVWLRAARVNALAPAVLGASFAGRFSAPNAASIVHVLDQKLANLNPDFLSYTASKAALACLSEMQAKAFAPRVRVVSVAPGLTLPSGDQSEADFKASAQVNLLRRTTKPEEVAAAVFAAAAGPIATGQTIFVDSGQRLLPLDRDVMFLQRAQE